MGIYESTGMSNAPMFINSQPFALDFSRAFSNQDRIFALANDLQNRFDTTKAKAAALEIPEMEGPDNDRLASLSQAMAYRSAYQNKISSAANPIAAAKSPEAMADLQGYQRVIDPTRQALAKERRLDLENGRKTSETKQGVLDSFLTDSQGNIQSDPRDPSKPLKWSQGLAIRNADPNLTMASRWGSTFSFQNSMNTNADELSKYVTDALATTASTVNEWRNGGGQGGLPATVQATNGLLYTLSNGGASSGNRQQVLAGLSALTAGMPKNYLYAMFSSGYQNTAEFARGMKNHAFEDENGRFSSDKAYNAMLTGLDETIPVGDKTDSKGKLVGTKVSYADKWLYDEAKRFISSGTKNNQDYTMIAGQGVDNTTDKLPALRGVALGVHGAAVPKNGNPLEVGDNNILNSAGTSKQMVIVPGVDNQGNSVLKQYGVSGVNYTPQMIDQKVLRERLGLDVTERKGATKDGATSYNYPLVSDVRPDGNLFSTVDGNPVPFQDVAKFTLIDNSAALRYMPTNTFVPGAGNAGSYGDGNGTHVGAWKSTMKRPPNGVGTGQPDVEIDANMIVPSNGNSYTQPTDMVTVWSSNKDDFKKIKVAVPKGYTIQDNGNFTRPIASRSEMDSIRVNDPGKVRLAGDVVGGTMYSPQAPSRDPSTYTYKDYVYDAGPSPVMPQGSFMESVSATDAEEAAGLEERYVNGVKGWAMKLNMALNENDMNDSHKIGQIDLQSIVGDQRVGTGAAADSTWNSQR